MAEDTGKLAELKATQYAFAAHIRDPDNQPAPGGIEARRIAIYRDLFFNNVSNFLGGNFPILRRVLGPERWRAVVRDYYRDHRSHAPLFPDMPRDFLLYLSEERPARGGSHDCPDPPFMAELAHYEWVQWGLLLAADAEVDPALDPDGDPLEAAPVIAEPAWLLSYHYPVNEINVHRQPCLPEDEPRHFMVFRDDDDEVVFTRLNAVSARLFSLLQADRTLTGKEALRSVAAELQHPEPDRVVVSGRSILERWRSIGAILGTRNAA